MKPTELAALHAAATPGERHVVRGNEPLMGDGPRGGAFGSGSRWTVSPHPGVPGWDTDGGYDGYGIPLADAALIATTHNLAPLLVALWEAAAAMSEQLEDEHISDEFGAPKARKLRAALAALGEVGT